MIGIVLALLSAMVYSFSVVLVGKKLNESNFVSAAVVLTVTGNLILWPLALLFTDFSSINFEGVLFYVIAGILAPGIARLSYYKGVEVVGVSVNSSIFATNPMFSSLLAVLLLSEVLAPGNWIGIICIIVGVVYIERSLGRRGSAPKRIPKKGLVFPLLAGLAIAFSVTARKYGLNIYNEPLFGVAIGYASSLLLLLLLSIFSPNKVGSKFSGRDFQLFWKGGVGLSLAWVLSFYALSQERLSVVAPLMQTEPLFVLFFVYIYLRELEKISLKLVISTLLIVMGVMLVSFR